MINKRSFFLVSLILLPYMMFAQAKMTTEAYIEKYKDIAVQKMKEYGIPASITLAQGILESGSGNSELAVKANNHFGIKCHKEWTGDTYTMDDDEKNECFRKYKNAEDSYRDHSLFLTTRERYSSLFDLKTTDYKGWAKGLKAAGYATNPRYPELLIGLIERYNLDQYDDPSKKKPKKVEVEVEPVQEDQTTSAIASVVYAPDDKSSFNVVDRSENGRFIYENNGVKFIFAKDGDTPSSIAEELHIYSHQIYKYNYLERKQNVVFSKGDLVYIEPLKNKSKQYAIYSVKPNEDIRYVALKFGVKMNKLLKINNIEENTYIPAGRTVKLRRR